jgi:hypothetical protein
LGYQQGRPDSTALLHRGEGSSNGGIADVSVFDGCGLALPVEGGGDNASAASSRSSAGGVMPISSPLD